VQVLRNPLRSDAPTLSPADPGVWAFHRRMPAYAPTPLFDCPDIARRLGVARVLVKAETQRMGLPSFKILGASWATYRALVDHLGAEPTGWANTSQLAHQLEHLKPFALAAATDGNHGRAVAHMARLLGFECRIFVPDGMVPARIEGIESEGAMVTVVPGDYDAAVARSAEEASDRCLVISDTSWPGYDITPRRVVEGYSTIFNEVDSAVAAAGMSAPNVVAVPVGVGAFMAAAVSHLRSQAEAPTIIGIEPADADCVLESARAGDLVNVPGPHRSIMVGLNCGTPSMVAWPAVSSGVDWFAAVEDDWARRAMVDLAAAGVVAGETGAAALGGLTALIEAPEGAAFREAGVVRADSTVLAIVTEGATDPIGYEQIVGRPFDQVGTVLTVAR
jgi:diaminopropionate ammonia-lyase